MQTIQPNYSEPYMSGAQQQPHNIPAYNPADYGPTSGPTLPRDEPPHEYPYPNQAAAAPYPEQPYGGPFPPNQGYPGPGPENVSAPQAYERSEPGMSRQS